MKSKTEVFGKDYINEHKEELDYQIENAIYLKDMKEHQNIKENNVEIDYYTNKGEKIKLDIVVKNGNIYIKTDSEFKVESVDSSSSVEFINEHYKKINKEDALKYEFDFEKIINKNIKKRYSSILNPITTITNGFKVVFHFSVLKKILLLGFAISAMFVMYAAASITATLKVEDKDFVAINKNYLNIIMGKVNVYDYLAYEQDDNIYYLLPGDSKISLQIKYDDFYQTSDVVENLSGSLSTLKMITNEDLILRRNAQNRV